MILYSIKDKRAEEFGPVFQAKNDEVAKRMYAQTIQGDRVLYVDDYSLWSLADFDTETGVISADKRLVYEPKSEIVQAGESDNVAESNHRSVFNLFRQKSSSDFDKKVKDFIKSQVKE